MGPGAIRRGPSQQEAQRLSEGPSPSARVARTTGRHVPGVKPQPCLSPNLPPHLRTSADPVSNWRPAHTPPTPSQRAQSTHPAHTTSIPFQGRPHISPPTSPHRGGHKHSPNPLHTVVTLSLTDPRPAQLVHIHTHPHTAGTTRATPCSLSWHTLPMPSSPKPGPTPTHQRLLVLLCHELPLGRLLLGRRQRSPRPSPPDISVPSTHLPGPLPSAHPAPSAARQSRLLLCPGRAVQPGLTWADSDARLPRLTTASRRPRQASARPRPSTSGASRAVPGSPRRPLRLWLRRAAMGAGGCACLTAPPSRDPRDRGRGSRRADRAGEREGPGKRGGRGGNEDRKPDTVCVIRRRAGQSAVQGAGRALRSVQSPERVPAGLTHRPGV